MKSTYLAEQPSPATKTSNRPKDASASSKLHTLNLADSISSSITPDGSPLSPWKNDTRIIAAHHQYPDRRSLLALTSRLPRTFAHWALGRLPHVHYSRLPLCGIPEVTHIGKDFLNGTRDDDAYFCIDHSDEFLSLAS